MRVLLVEDDPVLADGLERSLRQNGYIVDAVDNGNDADLALSQKLHDVVLLDLSLPGIDGLEVLRRLRARKSHVPVLILTARDALEDRVRGLDLGADDYLTKPFDLPELEARVRALLRRGQDTMEPTTTYGSLTYDSGGRRLSCNGQVIDLSARELAVWETLLARAGRVVSKEAMIEKLCAWDTEISINAVEVYVHRLRKKLEPFGIEIRTARGLGYLLEKQ